MPSRKPRSATRSIGLGQSEQMAAKMAEPASIRSARSGPMAPIAASAGTSRRETRSTTDKSRAVSCQLASTLARL